MPFEFEGKEVRVFEDEDGNPSFVVSDVCAAIGIGNPTAAVANLDEDEKGLSSIKTPSGTQEMVSVTESGLYTLILRCRDAVKQGTAPHRFRKWVTGKVLPSIRKTGRYEAPRQATRIPLTCDGMDRIAPDPAIPVSVPSVPMSAFAQPDAASV